MPIAWIGDNAGILQGDEYIDQIALAQLQGEEMLADFDIVILDTAQGVAIGLARKELAAGSGPGWRRDLQDKSFPGFVPSEHAFRMAPGTAAAG